MTKTTDIAAAYDLVRDDQLVTLNIIKTLIADFNAALVELDAKPSMPGSDASRLIDQTRAAIAYLASTEVPQAIAKLDPEAAVLQPGYDTPVYASGK